MTTEYVEHRNRSARARAETTAVLIETIRDLSPVIDDATRARLFGVAGDTVSIQFRLARVVAILDRPDIIRPHSEIR